MQPQVIKIKLSILTTIFKDISLFQNFLIFLKAQILELVQNVSQNVKNLKMLKCFTIFFLKNIGPGYISFYVNVLSFIQCSHFIT